MIMNRIRCISWLLLVLVFLFVFTSFGALAEKAYVADYAGVLSAEEAASLEREAQRISEKYDCDVIVVFVSGTNGYSSLMNFSEDFFLQNSYGRGVGKNGVMLLTDVKGREYRITTSGSGISAFTDAGQSYLKDLFVPYLSNKDWSGAARSFLSGCDKFLRQAQTGDPYDIGNMPKNLFSLPALCGAGLFGLLAGAIPLRKAKKEMENVQSKNDAEEYIRSRPVSLKVREDLFLGTHMSRTPLPKVTDQIRDGGGGGSSVHTHSSGHTFGGSGGKF